MTARPPDPDPALNAAVAAAFAGYLRLVGDLFRNRGAVAGTHRDADGFLRYDPVDPEPPR